MKKEANVDSVQIETCCIAGVNRHGDVIVRDMAANCYYVKSPQVIIDSAIFNGLNHAERAYMLQLLHCL